MSLFENSTILNCIINLVLIPTCKCSYDPSKETSLKENRDHHRKNTSEHVIEIEKSEHKPQSTFTLELSIYVSGDTAKEVPKRLPNQGYQEVCIDIFFLGE